jgi:hypothetical protein
MDEDELEVFKNNPLACITLTYAFLARLEEPAWL